MPDSEVKRRTGFPDVSTMIAYIIVIFNGDFEKVRERRSPLTWFKEWFLLFEWKYGKTNRRQVDMEKAWDLHHFRITIVKNFKLAIEVAALRSWPRFASYDEDMELRKRGKWGHYDEFRPILWDMTNISAPAFSGSPVQRGTWSDYYGKNCFKGGVFFQLCGWLGGWTLWGGGVSDTDYNKRAGYLEEQEKFQLSGLVGGAVVAFLNILDRVY